ncbi:MAG: hypothetical protein LBH67_03410, partial [Rickettsia sp.]|nr:hypothetical protein [Rickettsia sp.]
LVSHLLTLISDCFSSPPPIRHYSLIPIFLLLYSSFERGLIYFLVSLIVSVHGFFAIRQTSLRGAALRRHGNPKNDQDHFKFSIIH